LSQFYCIGQEFSFLLQLPPDVDSLRIREYNNAPIPNYFKRFSEDCNNKKSDYTNIIQALTEVVNAAELKDTNSSICIGIDELLNGQYCTIVCGPINIRPSETLLQQKACGADDHRSCAGEIQDIVEIQG